MSGVVRHLSAISNSGGTIFLPIFIVNISLLLYYLLEIAKHLHQRRNRIHQRAAALSPHGVAISLLLLFAVLIRMHYAPMCFQTIGLDSWKLNDALRFLGHYDNSGYDSIPHAAFFGLYLYVVDFNASAIFYFNTFLGILFILETYILLCLMSAPVPVALAGSFVISLLPAAVVTSGGILDNTLSGVLALASFISLYLFWSEKKDLRLRNLLFSTTSLLIAATGQARRENFIFLVLYLVFLFAIRKDIPLKLKTKLNLIKNLLFACLCLPYSIRQIAAHALFHFSPSEIEQSSFFDISGIGDVFQNLLKFKFVWFYDGVNLSAGIYLALAFVLFLAAKNRNTRFMKRTLPLLVYFPLYLGIYVPASKFAMFSPWYPLLAATFLVILIFVSLNRLVKRKAIILGAAAALSLHYFAAQKKSLSNQFLDGKFTAALCRHLQDSVRRQEDVVIILQEDSRFSFGWLFLDKRRISTREGLSVLDTPGKEIRGKEIYFLPGLELHAGPVQDPIPPRGYRLRRIDYSFSGNRYTYFNLKPKPPLSAQPDIRT